MVIQSLVVAVLLILGTTSVLGQSLDARIEQLKFLALDNEVSGFDIPLEFEYRGSYPLTPLDFEKKKEVFWKPVDMGGAIANSNNQRNNSLKVRPIQVKAFGFSTATQYTADGQSKVVNTVYQDMRGLQLISPCPPIGMCWRCAPYRSNSIFRQP